jgi:hypothetical protein
MLVLADRRNKVWNALIKNVCSIFGASRRVNYERVDWLPSYVATAARSITAPAWPVTAQFQPPCRPARIGRTDVVILIFVLPLRCGRCTCVLRRPGLSVLPPAERRRIELVGNNSLQVLLERQFMDLR